MNKKQLIVAWVMLFLLSGCCHPKGVGQLTNGKGYIRMDFKIPFGKGDTTSIIKQEFPNITR